MENKQNIFLCFTKKENEKGELYFFLKNKALPQNPNFTITGLRLGTILNQETKLQTMRAIDQILELSKIGIGEDWLLIPKFNTEIKFSGKLKRHSKTSEVRFSLRDGEIEHEMHKDEQLFFARILMDLCK